MKSKLIHVVPDSGGIAAYGTVVEGLYAGIDLVDHHALRCAENLDTATVVKKILKLKPQVVHFEIGSGQTSFFQASRFMSRHHPEIKQLVTIHDTQLVLAHPSGWRIGPGRDPLRLASKVGRKVLDKVSRQTQVKLWLADKQITFITLRKGSLPGSQYLPQATYLSQLPKAAAAKSRPQTYGFAGYWGRDKGLETLLAAYQIFHTSEHQAARLVIHGGGFSGSDAFIDRFKKQAIKVPSVELPGLMPELKMNSLLNELDVVVLPYWLNNPAGASAMAMRAAELGRPIIASRAPQLTELLGDQATYYDPGEDEQALAQAMSKVYDNYPAALKTARKLQTEIFATRSHTVVQQQLEKIILSVI